MGKCIATAAMAISAKELVSKTCVHRISSSQRILVCTPIANTDLRLSALILRNQKLSERVNASHPALVLLLGPVMWLVLLGDAKVE